MALEALGIGALIAAVGGVSWVVLRVRRAQIAREAPAFRAPWLTAAEALGLGFEATEAPGRRSYRLTGRVEGHEVTADFDVRGEHAWPHPLALRAGPLDTHVVPPGRTRVAVAVRAPLPRGLHLRRETAATEALRYAGVQDILLGDPVLDGSLHVRCASPVAAARLASHPAGRRALHALARAEHLEVASQEVIDAAPGEQPAQLAAMVRRAVSVATDLEAAAAGPLDAVAAARGLTRATDPEAPAASGQVRGHQVRLTASADGTALVVRPAHPPPPDLWVAAQLAPHTPGEPLGLANPILSRLIAARAAHPEAAARWLTEATTEPLLAVIQGHAGARVDGGAVHLALPAEATAEALDAAVEDALRLADAWCG